MKFIYKDTKNPNPSEVLQLYGDVKWSNYTDKPQSLFKGIKNSLEVITAWQDDKLVGLIRAVGDGESILYIQDILVLKDYKRNGIGTELVKRLLAKYPHIRQKVLLTDDSEETRGFYESLGFKAAMKGLISFVKFD
ncbi:GNAT family N-acetyltransferase [Proteinivorax hydrogeniformans]|uniref:GNAT family N-acetyltransferase n=1 Tax=Proteinivorax hydrogeniformans TaxID=1826727 RepID=A0AAU8HVN8_9FIRM